MKLDSNQVRPDRSTTEITGNGNSSYCNCRECRPGRICPDHSGRQTQMPEVVSLHGQWRIRSQHDCRYRRDLPCCIFNALKISLVNEPSFVKTIGIRINGDSAPIDHLWNTSLCPTVRPAQYPFVPGTQLVPASGRRAIAAASTVNATRSSRSRWCTFCFPQARAMVVSSMLSVFR